MFNYQDLDSDLELNNGIYTWDLSQADLRALFIAQWVIDNKVSIRKVAREFGVGKSTAYEDCTIRLKRLSIVLYDQVKTILRSHKSSRF